MSATLTKKEIERLAAFALTMPRIVDGCCFLNAQRVAMRSLETDIRLSYHEGFFHRASGRGTIIHAWNSLNGKLVDFSFPLEDQIPEVYKATCTFTPTEVVRRIARVKHYEPFTQPNLKLKPPNWEPLVFVMD